MKTVFKQKAAALFALLFASFACCLIAGLCVQSKTARAAENVTTVNVEVTALEENTGFIWFTLSENDYTEASYNESASDSFYEKLNALNTLENIEFDGEVINTLSAYSEGFSKSANDPYLNLWSRNPAGFTFSLAGNTPNEITVKAGCEFPSYAYASGSGNTVYVTTQDVTFIQTDGRWDISRPELDLPSSVAVQDWGTNWSTDTTQIMILPSLGNFDASGYVNDNPNTYPVDLAQYIVIGDAVNENGAIENGKTVRELIQQNETDKTYAGIQFPMGNGGIYSPVLVYGANDHVQVIILNSFKAQGEFTLTIKAGFTLTIGGTNYITREDIVYGYVSSFDGSGMTPHWTRFYEITWNVEGEQTKQLVPDGTVPEFKGSTAKESTVSTDYTFIGWNTEVAAAYENASYTAVYTESARKYDVTFMNGEEVFAVVPVAYGTSPALDTAPEKAPTAQVVYTFAGWSAEEEGEVLSALPSVTGEATYYAVYTQSDREYTVTYANGGDTLASYTVKYGAATPEYSGETPSKAADAQYTYTFGGWGTIAETVTEDAVYEAQFTGTLNTYTVAFMYGTEKLAEIELEYGETPAYVGEIPSKAADAQYAYTFAGWATEEGGEALSELFAVTGNAVYYAAFTGTLNRYKITVHFEGMEKASAELTLDYGAAVDFSQFAEDGYTFTVSAGGEGVESFTVTGEATLTVTYAQGASTGGCKGSFTGASFAAGAFAVAIAACALSWARRKKS